LRLFSFGGYGLALAALALVVFGAYDSYLTRLALKSVGLPFVLNRPVISLFVFFYRPYQKFASSSVETTAPHVSQVTVESFEQSKFYCIKKNPLEES